MFVRKSLAVVVRVTSAAALPAVGLTATIFNVNFGAARFEITVIFLRLLLVPHRRELV
jgi:hypothetical protein